MAIVQTLNPLSGQFDSISVVTIGTANGLSIDANQVLSLALATSSTPGAVLNIGSANGVATLDSSGKIPIGQLPSVVMEYQGGWNPNTNSPALVDGTGTNGYVYYVTAARSAAVTGLTDPSMVNFQIGDLVIYSSSVGKYQLTTPAAGVSSVNGAQGAVIVNAINQLTGDVTAPAATQSQSEATTVAKIQGTTVSGTTGSGSVAFSNSPVFTGNITVPQILTPSSTLAIDVTNRQLKDSTGVLALNWGGRYLVDVSSNVSIDWQSRLLYNAAGSAILNWNNTDVRLPYLSTAGVVLNDASGNLTSSAGPLSVSNGGTGDSTLTPYAVLAGGTTSTGALQQVSGVGTTGQVLTSNGASALPTWQTSSTTPIAPTIQKFTSGSGTYTLPTSPRAPLYIRVTAVGGGGGGGGAGLTNPVGSSGGNTSFGSSIIVANGGAGGQYGGVIASGGTATLGSAVGIAIRGGDGGGAAKNATSGQYNPGGAGASSALGGAGAGTDGATPGSDADANSGSGGGGGGTDGTPNSYSGCGGAAGGYVCGIITAPSSTYSYAVGAGGAGGAAGSDGGGGGGGGAGIIIVEEFYQ